MLKYVDLKKKKDDNRSFSYQCPLFIKPPAALLIISSEMEI